MKVDFVDLRVQYESIKDEIGPVIQEIIESSAFVLGKGVEGFEGNFSTYVNVKHSIGVNSGTSALVLALQALGIGGGDEVILPPNTFIATAEAVSIVGAKPVFVDIDAKTYNIDTDKIEHALTDKTKAIIPVHLYGQPAEMDPVMEIAEEHDLFVVEDSCQAHGAEYGGKKTGSIGHVGCFSFYPAKNLGAYGEGGLVTTNDDKTAEKVRLLRDHGSPKRHHHPVLGWNARMEGIQGAVLNVKLKHLDRWTDMRRKNASLYNEMLSGLDVVTPFEDKHNKHVYHLYVVKVRNRDGLIGHLKSKAVHTGIHYPVPIHLQPAYKELRLGKGSFPVTEEYVDKIVSLPMFPELKEEEISYVCESMRRFFKKPHRS